MPVNLSDSFLPFSNTFLFTLPTLPHWQNYFLQWSLRHIFFSFTSSDGTGTETKDGRILLQKILVEATRACLVEKGASNILVQNIAKFLDCTQRTMGVDSSCFCKSTFLKILHDGLNGKVCVYLKNQNAALSIERVYRARDCSDVVVNGFAVSPFAKDVTQAQGDLGGIFPSLSIEVTISFNSASICHDIDSTIINTINHGFLNCRCRLRSSNLEALLLHLNFSASFRLTLRQ